jgi:Calpain family cysteine protease
VKNSLPKRIICNFAAAIFLIAAANAQTAGDFLSVVKNNFPRWDLNHNGVLSSNELDAAISDARTTGADAAAIAALKRASRLTKTPLPEFSFTNIATMTATKQPDLAQFFRDGLKRIQGATNRNLFADGLPYLETIHQGKLGNCFCLAPLGAMVARDPAQVAAMFVAETNGNFCVHLGKKMVEVAPPSDAEIAMSSSNEHEGIWVNLYEKAVGTARNDDRPENERLDSPLDALARGGSAGTMLAYITGHEMQRFSFKFAKIPASATNDISAKLAELREKLRAATAEKRLMTCGTIKPATPDLTPNHAYAVLSYDAAHDAVKLWNPHGQNFTPKAAAGPENGYVTAHGVFEIPLTEFVKQFSGMAFEILPLEANKT